MLTLGKSVAEVWDYRQPNSPLAFAVQPEDGAGGKYRPVENAALSADGAYFATVYRTGAIVSRTDGESVAMYKEAPHARTRLHKAAVAVRFSLTNELLIARAGVSHLIRYPAPGCGAAVASDAP